ncbi:MAG: molybdopterin-dependent oxidoreductase [Chloroflexi bacterium]|nr:molybdopterin-dependent oxidoreductase [Chloroflexota bacterium]
MRFPWANTLLLALIGVELVSGFFGLVSNSPDEAVFILAHRIAGWGIVAVLVWKAANVIRSLRWHRSAAPRTASIVLAVALLATLTLGFAWSFVGPYSYWLFSGVSWHIYIGALLLPILIWHSLYHTRGFPLRFWVDRRTFLRFAGLAIASAALWRAGEVAASVGGLSGATRRFTGSYEAGSFTGNAFPLTSWLNDNPRPIDAEAWRLNIGGAVANPTSIRYADITDAETTTATETIDCTGGWHSTQVWRGIALSDLLRAAQSDKDAASVTVRSVTGYYRRFSMSEANEYILATHVGDERLSHGHGFPLRLVAHDKRGFEWVKWITEIEVNRTGKWLQPPLPLQ